MTVYNILQILFSIDMLTHVLIGLLVVVSFAAVLILAILYTHRGEINHTFEPGTPFIRKAWLYLNTTKPGKHALKGIVMFVGVGGVMFGLFMFAADTFGEEPELKLFSSARIELGVIRAPGNAYAIQNEPGGMAHDWVSHGAITFSVAKYKCVDVNVLAWFHQSAAFVTDARTLDASGLTISCTVPLKGLSF